MSETFFRPPVVQQSSGVLSAEIYNHSRLLLAHAKQDCAFVPIRSMQFMAVIDLDEIIFVDAIGRHIVHQGQAGRVIKTAWRQFEHQAREDIHSPVSYQRVIYWNDAEGLNLRLVGEFNKAMVEMLARQQSQRVPKSGATIISLPINPPANNP